MQPRTPAADPELFVKLRERRFRDDNRLYLAEGQRALHSAIQHLAPIQAIAYCKEQLHSGEARRLIRSLDCPTVSMNEERFAALTQTIEPQGVLLAIRQEWDPLPCKLRKGDLWLGIEKVRSPGNLGTLLRSAQASGARGLIVFGPVRDRADPFDPAVVRASMGSIFAMSIVQTCHSKFRSWDKRYEMRVLGADGEASTDYRRIDLRKPALLMLGEERSGLTEAQRGTCDGFLRIPMAKGIDSLNLAMAGTVLLYEAFRQRNPLS